MSQSIRVVARWAVVGLSAFVVSCAAFMNTSSLTGDVQYDLSGRLRVAEGSSILRGDFRLTQTHRTSRLLLMGPLGLGRTEVFRSEQGISITQKGETQQIKTVEQFKQYFPGAEWLMDISVIDWLTLRHTGNGNSQSSSWKPADLEIKTVERQSVLGKGVCRRLEIHYADTRIDVFCDRWKVLDGRTIGNS